MHLRESAACLFFFISVAANRIFSSRLSTHCRRWDVIDSLSAYLVRVESSSTHSQVYLVNERERMEKRSRAAAAAAHLSMLISLDKGKRSTRVDHRHTSLSLSAFEWPMFYLVHRLFSNSLLSSETIQLLMILMLINWRYLRTTDSKKYEFRLQEACHSIDLTEEKEREKNEKVILTLGIGTFIGN